jgi:hypothetical protein
MSTPKIVGLCGPAGAGKSTASIYLCKTIPAFTLSFASPIKAMIRRLLELSGYAPKDAQNLVVDPTRKNEELENLPGYTPRQLLQTLGTEWARNSLHPDFWCQVAAVRLNSNIRLNKITVFDDVRFENEAALIRVLGGIVIGIRGRAAELPPSAAAHASEQGVEPDFWIDNTGTVDDLHRKLDEVIETYYRQPKG